jgi:7-cyano-7-deazaguanine synthase
MPKVIVLSSGGVDSTTCLGLAVYEYGAANVTSVSMYYGQKHKRELAAASKVAEHYNVKHIELDLSVIFKHSNCPLLGHSTQEVPEGDYADQIGRSVNGMVSTFVPFRNGMFLSAAASLAVSLFPDEEVYIYIGAHADDAAGNAYADCSENFIDSMNDAIYLGTYGKVSIKAPFAGCNKAQIVAKGLSPQLSVPYHLTTSCYNGREKACGKCGTCIDRVKAFRINNAIDPIDYEIEQSSIGVE